MNPPQAENRTAQISLLGISIFGIYYPNELDKKHAESIDKSPGGLIKIQRLEMDLAGLVDFIYYLTGH